VRNNMSRVVTWLLCACSACWQQSLRLLQDACGMCMMCAVSLHSML
jgi:hypothetical protein